MLRLDPMRARWRSLPLVISPKALAYSVVLLLALREHSIPYQESRLYLSVEVTKLQQARLLNFAMQLLTVYFLCEHYARCRLQLMKFQLGCAAN